MNRVFRFFGGITMAISLIALATTLVIIGTFIESATGSHAHAASLTYSHPIFQGILGLFFVNILFSSLTRYPFQRKHIPFLITHLGLLLILAGTIAKNAWGLQGSMTIAEGSASRSVLIPNEFALRFEDRETRTVTQVPLSRTLFGRFRPEIEGVFPDLQLSLLSAAAHSIENRELWIKNDHLSIWGLPPIALDQDVPVVLHPDFNQKWIVRATISDQPIELAKEYLAKEAVVHLVHSPTGQTLKKIPLAEALAGAQTFSQGTFETAWNGDRLEFHIEKNGGLEKVELPLTGEGAGIAVQQRKYLGKPIVCPRIELPERILITKNSSGDNQITAISSAGAIHSTTYHPNDLSTIVLFHKGFDGYAAIDQLPLSFTIFPGAKQEEAQAWQLEKQIAQTMEDEAALSPPLERFKSAANDEMAASFVHFLQEWNQSGEWLYPDGKPLPEDLEKIVNKIELTPSEKKGALWISLIHQEIGPRLEAGEPLLGILQKMQWPLLHLLAGSAEPNNDGTLLTLLAEQVLLVENDLPFPDIPLPTTAHLYSALLRAYGLHWSELTSPATNQLLQSYAASKDILPPDDAGEVLAPITTKIEPLPPLPKWEENSPMVVIGVQDVNGAEKIALSWNPKAGTFPQPILSGRYLVSLMPVEKQLPFWLRLRSATQTNYPGTNQPFSYESDIVLVDEKGEHEISISMNRVHETADGTRIYMSNLTQKDGGAIHTAGLVINRDPYKYWITYPGALLVSLGILLLWNQFAQKGKNRSL